MDWEDWGWSALLVEKGGLEADDPLRVFRSPGDRTGNDESTLTMLTTSPFIIYRLSYMDLPDSDRG